MHYKENCINYLHDSFSKYYNLQESYKVLNFLKSNQKHFSDNPTIHAIYSRTISENKLFAFISYDKDLGGIYLSDTAVLQMSERMFRYKIKELCKDNLIKKIKTSNNNNCYCINFIRTISSFIDFSVVKERPEIYGRTVSLYKGLFFLDYLPSEIDVSYKNWGEQQMIIEDIIKQAEEKGRIAFEKRRQKIKEKQEVKISTHVQKLENAYKESKYYEENTHFFKLQKDKKLFNQSFVKKCDGDTEKAFKFVKLAIEHWDRLRIGNIAKVSIVPDFESFYINSRSIMTYFENKYGRNLENSDPIKQWVDEDGILHIGNATFR